MKGVSYHHNPGLSHSSSGRYQQSDHLRDIQPHSRQSHGSRQWIRNLWNTLPGEDCDRLRYTIHTETPQ